MNSGAALPLLEGVGQLGTYSFETKGAAIRLLLAPLLINVMPDVRQIALGRRAETMFKHYPHSSGAGNRQHQKAALPALFALDQCLADRVDFKAALLLSPDKIANGFAVIGVLSRRSANRSRQLAGR
nr:hypothetical protein [Sphingobium fuliginis]